MRRRSAPFNTALKLGELSLAAPQVMAHRVTRMALNGPFYSKRDQTEFFGMVHEKQLAFAQSWMAMFAEGIKLQQEFWLGWARSFGTRQLSASQIASGFMRVANKGFAPVHAKAVANSKRLARSRLR